MKFPVIIVAFLLSYSSFSQVPENFPYINKDNLREGRIKSEKTYTRESLFGYMNGGAELYLEYGFERLVVSELDIDGTEYKVEVYKMNEPQAAYGIYSVSVFRCDTSGHLDAYSCQTPYQLQVCRGQYYISIINNTGAPVASATSIILAQKLLPLTGGESFDLSGFTEGAVRMDDVSRATLIMGELGLFNGAFDWDYLLEGTDNYTGLALEKGDESVLILRFTNDSSRLDFFEKHGIRSVPGEGAKVSIYDNTDLTVKNDMLILTRQGS